MKKLLILLLALFMMAGCSKPVETKEEVVKEDDNVEIETSETKDYEALYQSTLDHYYEILLYQTLDGEDGRGDDGIMEVVMMFQDEAISNIGYSIEDISGDGVLELIIGLIDGTGIYDVYTLVDDKPQFVFEGWMRNYIERIEDNHFFGFGSNGAIYSITYAFHLSEDGTEVIYDDYCFSYEKNEDYTDVGFYRNTTGEWNPEVSEEMDEDEYWNKYDEYSQNKKPFTFNCLKDFDTNVPVFTVKEMEDLTGKEFVEFGNETSLSHLQFECTKTVEDFTLIRLTVEDMDDYGNVTFSYEPLLEQGLLEANVPFVANVTFMGDLPEYGITYTDHRGVLRVFGVEVSGMDGSLHLVPLV